MIYYDNNNQENGKSVYFTIRVNFRAKNATRDIFVMIKESIYQEKTRAS